MPVSVHSLKRGECVILSASHGHAKRPAVFEEIAQSAELVARLRSQGERVLSLNQLGNPSTWLQRDTPVAVFAIYTPSRIMHCIFTIVGNALRDDAAHRIVVERRISHEEWRVMIGMTDDVSRRAN